MSGGGDARPQGLIGSLRGLADSALELLQVRLALLGNELEEQKLRLGQALALLGLGLVLLTLAAVLLCGFVLLLLWDGYRLAAVGVLTLVFGGAGAWMLRAARERLRSSASMFQASMDELLADRASLGRRDAGPDAR